MKLNWGTGLALTFALFAAGMLMLVGLCIQSPQDLVSEDYYNKELAFQQQINKASNTSQLSHPLEFDYNPVQNSLTVIFPPELNGKSVDGTFQFFKPDNATLDFNVPVQPDVTSLRQSITTAGLKDGLWHIRADWKAGANKYYQEASLVITN